MAATFPSALSILRRKQVEARTGLSRSTIYAKLAAGTFPAPIALSDGERGALGWVESEISAWIAGQIAKTRQG